jgi:hypothetical protein
MAAKAGDTVYLVTLVGEKSIGAICSTPKSAFDAASQQLGEVKTGYRNYFNTLKRYSKATVLGKAGGTVRVGAKEVQ